MPARRLARIVALFLAAAALAASERRPLPAFSVRSPAGAAVASAALSSQSRWVLIYVSPDCRSCGRLLESLKQWSSPSITNRTILIVRGSAADAAVYVAAHAAGDGAPTWYADESGGAAQALGVRNAPMLIGVERGEIDWTIGGVLNDPKGVEPVIRKWIEY